MNAVTKHETHDEVAAPRQQADGLLGIIQRVATDASFDVEKMRALLEMRASEEDRVRQIEREDRAEAAKRSWLREFSRVQAEIGPIVRSRENKHTKSKYADLADIERIVSPVLTSHGFSTTCVPIPCEIAGCIRMRLTIGHEGGHENTYEDDFPLDNAGASGTVNKTNIQAKGSTQTYARRYLKASALDLSFLDDNDGNAVKSQNLTEEQFQDLRRLIELAGIDEQIVLDAEKVEALPFLAASRFEQVKAKLQKTIDARAAK